MGVYEFSAKTNSGEVKSLKDYAGKVLIIVNTASKCGFTPQYKELQELYDKYQDKGLEILGFPCNQFGAQEPGSNSEVQQFCRRNYGVSFQIFEKGDVRGETAQPLFKYLTAEKGTPLEKMAEMMALGEAKGTMMYYTLARLAKEQGLDDVAEQFIEAANQEAVHAGFYATVNGMLPKDFWQLVRGLMSAETSGEKKVKAMADKFREAGLAEAADEMEIFAKQEGHHGVVLAKILEKHCPGLLEAAGKKIYVCSVCGYEHVGDLDAEPDDFACPLCGQPKNVFKLKD